MHLRPPVLPFLPLRLLALALAVPLASCAAVVHQPLLAPEKGGPAWTEVTSEHFVLETDLDPDAARKASAKLEEMFAALSDVGFASAQRPKLRIDFVYFRSHDDYAELAPKLSDAVFLPEGRHDFEARPFALIGGDFVQQTRESLQHELTHLFVHYYYPQVPTWLNEGLARYMETMSIEDGVVVLGRQSRRHHFWKGPRTYHYDPSGVTLLLPMSEAPSPEELRLMSPSDFYGNRDLDPRTNEGQKAAEAAAVHYEAAWTLVHVLFTKDTYSDAFAKYLARIHDGDREDTAWLETIGRLPDAQLAKDCTEALVPSEVMLVRAKWSAPPYEGEQVRSMSNDEVHVLWARLRPDTPEGQSAADADLAEARKLGSGDSASGFALVHAYRLAQAKQNAEAEAALNEALGEHSEDPRLWNALGQLILRDNVDEAGHVTPAAQKALAPIADHLTPVAVSAAQLDLLANIRGAQGNADAALALEKRAMAVDPNCVTCLAEAARIFYSQGLTREALETATLALGLTREGLRLPRVEELVEVCRRKLAEAPAPQAASPGATGKAAASTAPSPRGAAAKK
jgi:tetratricopeptide (TPR) repeat protein